MPHPALLDGFKCFIDYLLDAEADYLCGILLPSRFQQRLNNRMGYHDRHIRTPLGKFLVRIPHLRLIHPRTSIVKRAKRLSPIVLDSLSRIHAGGATSAEAAALVNLVWTMHLPAALLEKLTAGLLPVLDNWRARTLVTNGAPVVCPAGSTYAVY